MTDLQIFTIINKMERCHKAAKTLLGSEWEDNVQQWKTLIDMHQKVYPAQSLMESVLFIAKSIEGAKYSIIVLMGVAYELLSKEDNGK